MNTLEGDLTGFYRLTPLDTYLLARDAVPAVDLSIADSPVLAPYRKRPVHTQRTNGRNYILLYNDSWRVPYAQIISEEQCKLYRATYLVYSKYYQLYLDGLAYGEQRQVVRDYFQGSLVQLPEPLLKQMRITWRHYLERLRDAPLPPENTVEGTVERTRRQTFLTSGN